MNADAKWVRVRFTGKRLAAQNYTAGTRKYPMCQLPGRQTVIVPAHEWPIFKENYGIEILRLPLDFRSDINLGEQIELAGDLIEEHVRELLLKSGYETLGEILATDDLSFVPDGEKLRRKINIHFGIPVPDLPKVQEEFQAEPAEEEPKPAPKRRSRAVKKEEAE